MSEVAEWMTAIGTVGAVVVALFADRLRALFAAPKLEIGPAQSSPNGTYIPVLDQAGKPTGAASRWHHLRVYNARRWTRAEEVRLLLLRLERRDAAGKYQIEWAGEIPLQWKHPEITPLTPRIGPSYEVDVCSVHKDQAGRLMLYIHPIIRPFHLPSVWDREVQFALTVQARGVASDSDEYRVEISWDGQWCDEPLQMQKYLVVTRPQRIVPKRKD